MAVTLSLSIMVVFFSLIALWALAEHVAARRNRRASEALNQRHRIGL